jgi:nitrate/nitrite transporter NarK
MEKMNFIQKLRRINRRLSFNIYRVRIGCLEMALIFLFAIGEKLVTKFVPMEPATKEIVSETLSTISVFIFGEAVMRSLFKLLPRYCWGTLSAMIGGAIGGLLITIVMDYFDSETAVDTADFIALGLCVVLFGAAYLFWRHSINRAMQLKHEREECIKLRKYNNI